MGSARQSHGSARASHAERRGVIANAVIPYPLAQRSQRALVPAQRDVVKATILPSRRTRLGRGLIC